MGIAVLQGTLPENTDLEYITSVSFSGVSSVNVDNCFSANYQHYLITRNLSGAAAGSEIEFRLRASGTTDTGANYRRQRLLGSSTTVTGLRSTGVSYWPTGLGITQTPTMGYSLLRISNPYEAVRTTAWASCSDDALANIGMRQEALAHDLASSYDGFTFYTDATTNMTGAVTVWGITP